jgi:hypothetical protein
MRFDEEAEAVPGKDLATDTDGMLAAAVLLAIHPRNWRRLMMDIFKPRY